MKHYLLLTAATLAMTASVTTVNAQDDDFNVPSTVRKHIATYYIGSTQETGQEGDENAISRKEINYYDLNNRLVYTAKYGTDVKYAGFTLTDFVKYAYSQEGDTLVQTAVYNAQWGKNDFGDDGFKYTKAGKLTLAKYVDGKIVKKDDSGCSYDYEYNADGTLAKETKIIASTGKISEVTKYTYSEGVLIADTVSDNLGGYKRNNVYEYDDAGNKIKCLQYKRTDKSNENTEYIYQEEDWVYTDGVLTDYWKATGGKKDAEPVRNTHYTYEPYEGNPYMTKITTYSYSNQVGDWTRGGLPKVEVYADLFDAETNKQLFATTVEAAPIEGTHNVAVSFQLPMYATVSLAKFNVYRDCQQIASLDINSPEVDQETGLVNLVDSTLRQGQHEYFVGIEIGNADELAEAEDVMWTYANITDVANTNVDFGLKPVTDLKLVKAEVAESEDGDGDKIKNLTATVSFKTPEYKPEDGFVKNELYSYSTSGGVKSYGYMDETKNGEDTTLTCVFPQTADSIDVTIITHYADGNVKSEMLNINKKQFYELVTSVASLTADEGLGMSLNTNAVSINGKANIHVLTADGKQVASAKNASSLSLAGVHGAYVVCIEKNGKILKAMKGVRK